MKKVIICILFLIIVLYGVSSYGEESTVYETVYCDNTVAEGHYQELQEALSNVAENGTVYIGKPINITSTIQISRSVTIKSLNRESYRIQIGNGLSQAFKLSTNLPWFTLDNISIISNSNMKAIEGRADQLTILNSKFQNCSPFYINKYNGYNITIKDSKFIDLWFYMSPLSGDKDNNLSLQGNEFSLIGKQEESVYLKNTNLEASGNTFSSYAFTLENGSEIQGNIYDNIFTNSGKIVIKNQGENVRFYNNRIIKELPNGIYYAGTGEGGVDFKYNWWGSKDGPAENIFNGNIDYSSWALFEDFSRFQGDPYTLEDLEDACSRLGQDIEEDNNWLYDINRNSIIDKLDLIGITRKIPQ